jgi:hypothetical protein
LWFVLGESFLYIYYDSNSRNSFIDARKKSTFLVFLVMLYQQKRPQCRPSFQTWCLALGRDAVISLPNTAACSKLRFPLPLHSGGFLFKQQTTPSSSHIPWHPAFFQAIKLELEDYKDALEFISEYQLNAEPLKIDVVIIKKAPELVIEKNIARIFKRLNILEYKSPEDYLSRWDFYKVFGYACHYASLNKTDMKDMTISLIGTRYPKALFSHFDDGNYTVSKPSPGIYSVSGYPLDLQMIESKKLPLEENLWLKGLSDDLNAAAAGIILEESHKRGAAELGAYIYALLKANTKTLQEVKEAFYAWFLGSRNFWLCIFPFARDSPHRGCGRGGQRRHRQRRRRG